MSITAQRTTILTAAAASLIVATGPASAQADQRTAINILVECSKIGDSTARLACYDNNINTARNSIPGAVPVSPRGVGGGAAPTASQGPEGFGFESVRVREERFETPTTELQEVQVRISSAREREPGIYLVTLEDGAEWLFSEGVDFGFRLPRRGQTVEIERGAMGSFLMRIDSQAPVPVRRVR